MPHLVPIKLCWLAVAVLMYLVAKLDAQADPNYTYEQYKKDFNKQYDTPEED